MISTVTISYEVNTTFNVTNIAKYFDITQDGIIFIKLGKPHLDNYVIRSYYPIYKKIKRKKITEGAKKNKPVTFNKQCTVKLFPEGSDQIVNVKLFNNGSIQSTGIRSPRDFNNVYQKLINELGKDKYIIKNGKLEKIHFHGSGNIDNASLFNNKYNFKICMINCTFYTYFKIKLSVLDTMIQNMGILSVFNFTDHACVNIKYNNNKTYDHDVSIFVFESGKINITGSRIRNEIASAYKFIVDILNKNWHDLILIPIDRLTVDELLSLANDDIDCIDNIL